MRAALLVVLVAACGGSPAPAAKVIANQAPALPPMPRIAAGGHLTPEKIHPQAIVFVDANGAITLGRVDKTWPGQLPTARTPIKDPDALATQLAKIALDDPPPPEAEDKPDDGDGGSMGTKDSGRTVDQYRMKSETELAREQAIQEARDAGIDSILLPGPPPPLKEVDATNLPGHIPLFVVAPTVPAGTLVELMVAVGGGAIAIEHAGKLQVLNRGFEASTEAIGGLVGGADVEVHLDVDGAHVLVAGKDATPLPWESGSIDGRKLSAAVRSAMKTKPQPRLEVLVAPNVSTQQLVETLTRVGATYTLGLLVEESAARVAALKKQYALPMVSIGNPNSQGDLDKAIIRRYIKRHIGEIQKCYEQELLKKPTLQGTVQVQFFIEPTGKVKTSSATGVDPAVANCVAGVIKAIEFPKPKGGGGVQVNYPFTFRPQD